ncbi:TPA: hypothetical protein UMT99_004517 [Stenotrophomonas maltophilia]|nr:hypothetical protein [Stenotrophomonas maltophilia]HEL3250126.1 hypothetical protein [Stenotrophomonas maltophilia]HEL3804945.1 hypothetical protein [Stenotrophomonas maltophilia]HEL3808336.1 hypothetical protein [Stenotrophomonas maltophilia]HEL4261751.1 hypothetical protein [Stenotrophomonas maltophilia]
MLRRNQGASTMKGISWVVAAALATVLGGCATLKARPDVPLSADEGYVVMSVNCATSNIRLITIFASGTRSTSPLADLRGEFEFGCRAGLAAVRAKAGRHYVGYLTEHGYGYVGAVPEDEALTFDVRAGETTYIGEVVVSGLFDRLHSRPTWISVRDREAESLRLLQQTQPWLLERHPFHTRLATPAPGAPSAEVLAEQFRSCTPACDSILALPLFIR